MAGNILDGKALAATLRAELAADVLALKASGTEPCLTVVIVGADPASRVYVNNKKKACADVGIRSIEHALPAETTQDELIALVNKLNEDAAVHGILVQLPLPGHIDEDAVIHAILPSKDVDCFHPFNVGRLATGKPSFMPCTPAGVMTLLDRNGISVEGKECVVVGRSNIVGKPQMLMLLGKNGTVTVCHSRTSDLKAVIGRADILVVAIGKAEFVRGEWIKPGAVVVDVGMNRLEDKRLVGDVHFESAAERASWITPVPGGVGPMTIATLMENTVRAARTSVKA